MPAGTLKIFIGQVLTAQYSDLKTAGAFVRKGRRNYKESFEIYTYLTAQFVVELRSGLPTKISIDCTKVPPMV